VTVSSSLGLADALQGVRVLDMSRLLPGPFLTMILADMGADVVKIEDPHAGDYMREVPPPMGDIPMHELVPGKGGISGRFLAVNRGKPRRCSTSRSPRATRRCCAWSPRPTSSSRASARA